MKGDSEKSKDEGHKRGRGKVEGSKHAMIAHEPCTSTVYLQQQPHRPKAPKAFGNSKVSFSI